MASVPWRADPDACPVLGITYPRVKAGPNQLLQPTCPLCGEAVRSRHAETGSRAGVARRDRPRVAQGRGGESRGGVGSPRRRRWVNRDAFAPQPLAQPSALIPRGVPPASALVSSRAQDGRAADSRRRHVMVLGFLLAERQRMDKVQEQGDGILVAEDVEVVAYSIARGLEGHGFHGRGP